mmetsp:Transcript_7852/g.15881  ORF Transcript_7852/g.15881 Transcript_7852/m.15881 type:complete len:297 (-) Transcript_7852:1490-2380(-)
MYRRTLVLVNDDELAGSSEKRRRRKRRRRRRRRKRLRRKRLRKIRIRRKKRKNNDGSSVVHEETNRQEDPPGSGTGTEESIDPLPTAAPSTGEPTAAPSTEMPSPVPSAAPIKKDSASRTRGTSTSAPIPPPSPAPTGQPKRSAYEPCDDDFQCEPNSFGQQACGHALYDNDSPIICCPMGAKIEVLDEGFCVDQGIGAACRNNEMCTSKICSQNICVAELLAAGEQCEDHEDCTPDDLGRQACGREFYDKSASKVCCPIGQEPQDYCLNQLVGAACRNGKMCSSGSCVDGICVAV